MQQTFFRLAFTVATLAAVPALAQQPAPAQEPAAKTANPKMITVASHYEGGQEAMYEFINKELKYPMMARRNRVQGTCIVSFQLNTDGTMSNVKLVKEVGGGTGAEALRVVKLLKFNKPDYPVMASIPVAFRLAAASAAAPAE